MNPRLIPILLTFKQWGARQLLIKFRASTFRAYLNACESVNPIPTYHHGQRPQLNPREMETIDNMLCSLLWRTHAGHLQCDQIRGIWGSLLLDLEQETLSLEAHLELLEPQVRGTYSLNGVPLS